MVLVGYYHSENAPDSFVQVLDVDLVDETSVAVKLIVCSRSSGLPFAHEKPKWYYLTKDAFKHWKTGKGI